jgi:hypothetical protein
MKLPFNVYDFFAYLSSGMVVGASLDIGVGYAWSVRAQFTPVHVLLLIVAAYVLGHIVAHLSSLVFEWGLVGRILGSPVDALMTATPPRARAIIFPGYYNALPELTRTNVLTQAERDGVAGTREALFLHAYSRVMRDREQRERLDVYLSLYGFARNMALACLFGGVALALGRQSHNLQVPVWIVWSLFASALLLVYRYLKFFRIYTKHVLLMYSGSPSTKG